MSYLRRRFPIKHISIAITCIFAGQAPEIFDFKKYLNACKKLSDEELLSIHGSSEPAIMAGMDIVTVPGEEQNFKITTAEDLKRFIELVGENNR